MVAEKERRYARGLDLWTGQPLEGADKREWERIHNEALYQNQKREIAAG